jgi:uncharacterized protein GlcG (DUF336 family)
MDANGITLEQLITEVKVLRLQPGDVVVLKSDNLIASGTTQALITQAAGVMTRFVGFRVSVIVIPADAEVDVLRSGDGTSILPHEQAAQKASTPIPMPPQGTNAWRVAKGPNICSTCREPQFQTPSGMTCRNGHGGAEGVEK